MFTGEESNYHALVLVKEEIQSIIASVKPCEYSKDDICECLHSLSDNIELFLNKQQPVQDEMYELTIKARSGDKEAAKSLIALMAKTGD